MAENTKLNDEHVRMLSVASANPVELIGYDKDSIKVGLSIW